jgi:ketosteroid isomerase-like protein
MGAYDAMIRAVAEGFTEHDLSRARALMHDDVVFDWTRSMSDNRGVYRGYEAIQKLFQDFIEAWEHVNWQVVDVEEVGPDRLLVARVTLFQDRRDAEAALADGDLD